MSMPTGAATGGALYLTNIHRLYKPRTRRRGDAETCDWMGPPVARAKALDTGEALPARVTSHPRLMVLNDEAHVDNNFANAPTTMLPTNTKTKST